MSKSAIATLKKAEDIMATAGVINIDLVAFLNDGKSRSAEGKKLWRNADKLALLIVDSAANAFQGENSQTLSNGDNFFSSMNQAVEAYISSNLDCWSQAELEDCTSFFKVDHLARLAEMVAANIAFEKRQAAHDEALAMNAEFDAAKVSRVIVEAAHGEALEVNESMPRAIIVGDIHCSSDCGYGCKAEVKRYLEARYAPIVEDLGEGWRVRSWHNTGWHCEAYHDASGASVSDLSLRGGVNEVRQFDMYGDRGRFLFNIYGDNGFIRQVQANGPTPHEAMMNAVGEMRAIAVANIQMADLLAGGK